MPPWLHACGHDLDRVEDVHADADEIGDQVADSPTGVQHEGDARGMTDVDKALQVGLRELPPHLPGYQQSPLGSVVAPLAVEISELPDHVVRHLWPYRHIDQDVLHAAQDAGPGEQVRSLVQDGMLGVLGSLPRHHL